MKSFSLVVLCSFLSLSLFGQLKYGFYLSEDRSFLGTNNAAVYNNNSIASFEVNSKNELGAGFFAQYLFNPKWGIQTGLLYSQKDFVVEYLHETNDFSQQNSQSIKLIGETTLPFRAITLPIECILRIPSENITDFALYFKLGARLDYLMKQNESLDAGHLIEMENKMRGIRLLYQNNATIDYGVIAGAGVEKTFANVGTFQLALAYNFMIEDASYFEIGEIEAPANTTDYNYTSTQRNSILSPSTSIKVELTYFLPSSKVE